MNNIKNNFSIKDLENLSGIKAHTIRIWEKRYNLLQPNRTDTNIRYYSLESLQKLLNITFLYNNGYKISKISNIGGDNIKTVVQDLVNEKSIKGHAVNAFKIAMLNFDQSLFFNTYKNLLIEKSFREIFYQVFIPFLEGIGLLWQTDTITPAHEHFISALIKQKILVNTEQLQAVTPKKKDKTFVLYLPDNEIHELGLMYINYEILRHNYQPIFLGQSIPIDNLMDLIPLYDNIVFVSYFTIKPVKDELITYIKEFEKKLIKPNHTEFWVLGRMLHEINTNELPQGITAFHSIDGFVKNL